MAEQPENLVNFEGSKDDLVSLVSKHQGLTVVKFGSTTCVPCRRVKQLLPGFARENKNVLFVNCEVDEHPEIGSFFGISSVPNVKYFKGALPDGNLNEVASVVGLNVPDIKAKIAQNA